MTRNDQDYRFLWHLMEHATHVLYIVMGLDAEAFTESTQVRLAAERCLDIMARAAGRITPAFKAAHPRVDWPRIAAVGATLDYPGGTPDDALVWEFLRRDLPGMLEYLDTALGPRAGAQEE
jgi:uncharacterized protein with HEPN domain